MDNLSVCASVLLEENILKVIEKSNIEIPIFYFEFKFFSHLISMYSNRECANEPSLNKCQV